MAAIWDVIGNVVQQGVGALMGSAGQLAKDLRTAITGTAPLTEEMRKKLIDQADAMEKAASDLNAQMVNGQIDLNKMDAQSTDKFRSYPRPFVMWVCAAGMVYQLVIWPFLTWGSNIWKFPVPPQLDMTVLMPLLFALLGLGTMRTVEKLQNKD
jgi:hypothetical protein